jgi:hypothetical protein
VDRGPEIWSAVCRSAESGPRARDLVRGLQIGGKYEFTDAQGFAEEARQHW